MLSKKEIIVVKDNLAKAIVENANVDSFEIVAEIAEEIMNDLDALLFSDAGESMTEQEVNNEVSTLIASNLLSRGLEIREMGHGH